MSNTGIIIMIVTILGVVAMAACSWYENNKK